MHQLPKCDDSACSPDRSANRNDRAITTKQSTKDKGLHHEAQAKKDHITTFTSLLHIRLLQPLNIPSTAALCLWAKEDVKRRSNT